MAFALAGLTNAAIDFTNWAPPGPGDIRGPCPAMNSMANHHIIPHNGKNLTVALLAEALAGTFNLSPEMGTIVSTIGLATAPDPSVGHFQLNHLNKHNAFEHDASLSRVDFYYSGEEGIAKFDNATFKRWFSHFDGLKYIDLEIAAKARYAMVQYSRKNTPGFTYEEQHRITSYAETIKFMKTMVDGTGKTRRDFVKILFEQERLPFREGWRPPTEQVTGFLMADFVLREALATPEKTLWFGEKPKDHHTTHDIPTKCKDKRAPQIRSNRYE
ncbi:Peroxidase, family 2-domain-containing protein [Dendryphion nanum]|uniref:Peroxidase, family 2-domain-containing protein n=1 Tax=Dendryphion nanum TaxID=256645 RepID=A0A9P9EFJ8_9PLEO|nr:Peroxidase, family 2-domain-containing protein [Dendryphion nanum]